MFTKRNYGNIFFQNKVLVFLLLVNLFGLSTLAICQGSNSFSNEKLPNIAQLSNNNVYAQDSEWLVLIYLDGDNNLEPDAIVDFNELEEGIGVSSSITVLVLFDRIDDYESSNGDWTNTRLYEVTSDSSATITSTLLLDMNELNMGASSSLEFLLNYGFANYSANHYWLNLWDHGGGINGICFDDTDYDFLTMDEMQDAIQSSELLYGKKLDLISHDACLMNMIEIAYELKDLADFFVASEETIPLDGFDYLEIMSQLDSNPTMSVTTLITHIIDSYSAFYLPETTDVTLSALNLTAMDSFVLQLDIFADNLSAVIDAGDGKSIEDAYFDTLFFDSYYSIDLKNFVEEILANTTLLSAYPLLNTAAVDLNACFSSLIYYNFQGSYYSGDANGVTIFMPINSPAYIDWINRYLTTDSSFLGMDWQSNTHWDDFLEDFYDAGFGYISTGHPLIELDSPTGATSIGEDEYHYFELRVYNIAIYELSMNVISGDADLYIANIQYEIIYQSDCWNPQDSTSEKIRVHLAPDVYIVAVLGFNPAIYNLEVKIVEPIEIALEQTVSASGGTDFGTDDVHFRQSLNHYYTITITAPGMYDFEITYDSYQVDYDLFLLSTSFGVIDSSESTSDTDSITLDLNFNGTSTIIIMVYGFSGYGSFTLEVFETPTDGINGFTIITTIISLATICGMAFFFTKRANLKK